MFWGDGCKTGITLVSPTEKTWVLVSRILYSAGKSEPITNVAESYDNGWPTRRGNQSEFLF